MIWLLIILSGCTVTIKPLPKTPSHRTVIYSNRSFSHKSEAKSSLVDSAWIDKYKEMEKEHGDYTIPDDANIESVNGKFRVTQSVKNHYQDMLRSKPTATPIQTNP
jgi:hypothetical protein